MIEQIIEHLKEKYRILLTEEEKAILNDTDLWFNLDVSPLGSDIASDSFYKYLDIHKDLDSDLKTLIEVFKYMGFLKFFADYSEKKHEEMISLFKSPKSIFSAICCDRIIVSSVFAQILLCKEASEGLIYELKRAVVRQTHPKWGEKLIETTNYKDKCTFYAKLLRKVSLLSNDHT